MFSIPAGNFQDGHLGTCLGVSFLDIAVQSYIDKSST